MGEKKYGWWRHHSLLVPPPPLTLSKLIELYAALVLDDQRTVLSRITIPAAGRRK